MAKIKVFKFKVSNAFYTIAREDYNGDKTRHDKAMKELVSPEQIEDTVNDFLEDKELISINVNNVDVNYHNNGYFNTIELVYTIVYK